MTRADDDEEPVLVPAARTSQNLLQRRATFETITNVFAGAEQTLGGESKSVADIITNQLLYIYYLTCVYIYVYIYTINTSNNSNDNNDNNDNNNDNDI